MSVATSIDFVVAGGAGLGLGHVMRSAALALAASTIAGAALASSDDKEAANPQPNWMTIEQVTKKLTDAGYKVRQVKAEDDGYEVSAIDMNGRRLEALVEARRLGVG